MYIENTENALQRVWVILSSNLTKIIVGQIMKNVAVWYLKLVPMKKNAVSVGRRLQHIDPNVS